jgi:hypothetical protein
VRPMSVISVMNETVPGQEQDLLHQGPSRCCAEMKRTDRALDICNGALTTNGRSDPAQLRLPLGDPARLRLSVDDPSSRLGLYILLEL